MTQDKALTLLKMGKNVFLTGAAGSGKTHVLNQYLAYLKEHGVEVGITASTGIAATHLGGVTIHSWSGIGAKAQISPYDLEAMEEKQYLFKRFEKTKVLIIDEISMLAHSRLDMVDDVLRHMKRNNKPFGGLQVVLCGDFFQLPPISRGEDEVLFAYRSRAWKEAKFTVCYLEEQFRQSDTVHTRLLNAIRSGEVEEGHKKKLMERLNHSHDKGINGTRLYTHNIDVDRINEAELSSIKGVEVSYTMETRGKELIVAALKSACLAPETLVLKEGAKVMCVKNNAEMGYVNGTLGIVVSAKRNEDPVIKTLLGKEIAIPKASWKIEEEGKTKAELIQYPLRLAWAITVHKSQGMSLETVEVDLSKSFEKGMGYVALSRVRTLSGLTLLGINDMALRVHDEVLLVDDHFKKMSLEAEATLEQLSEKKINEVQRVFIEAIAPPQKEKKISTYEKTAQLLREKKSLKDMAKMRGVTEETIISHLEALKDEESDVDMSYLKKEVSPAHFKKIQKVCEVLFEEEGKVLLSPVKHKVGASISFKDIRLVRVLLGYH